MIAIDHRSIPPSMNAPRSPQHADLRGVLSTERARGEDGPQDASEVPLPCQHSREFQQLPVVPLGLQDGFDWATRLECLPETMLDVLAESSHRLLSIVHRSMHEYVQR